MPGRVRVLVVVLVTLSAASLLVHLLNREPAPSERTLIAATGIRSVVDLLEAPASAELSLAGQTIAMPEPTGRWLICTLEQGSLRVGWLDDPEGTEEPERTIAVPAPGAVRIAAWPMRLEPDAVGIEWRQGWAPEARSVSGRIAIRQR